ncbi:hypothetical protein C8R42DRAFT_458299 [Lentinula raphanica]|nr:hypothetical protein C8R42DRAFT_458299 [Lentinula raphanica]
MDISQTQGKRKRETKAPRITYHAATRTFDRLFKEESLDETRDVVRKKLGLPDSSNIRLAQIRGDHTVDLEDEDDFDAFYAVAHSKMAIEVEVTIEDMPSPRHNPSLSLAVINQKAPSPTVLNDHIASPSEVPTGDEVRMARKDTFLGPSAAKESQSTNTALPQTELAADVTDPTPQPKKRKRKTEEKETSAKILPSAQNADESGSKPKPTKRAKKITEKETNDDSTTSQQPIKSTSTLTTKPNGQTLPDTFSQQLAQSITDGHLASTVPEDASTAPKRTKRRNSVAGQTAKAKASEKLTDVKAKVDKPVPNGELEATEQPTDGKSKPKKKKKEERVVTPAELEAVRGDMSQVVASLARELVGMVTTQPSQATTGSQKKPLTAKEILAAAKNKNTDRV